MSTRAFASSITTWRFGALLLGALAGASGCGGASDACNDRGWVHCPGTDLCKPTLAQCYQPPGGYPDLAWTPVTPDPPDLAPPEGPPDLAPPEGPPDLAPPPQATLTISRSAIDFGTLLVGTSGATQSVSLRNDSSVAIDVQGVYFSDPAADFASDGSCASRRLLPGDSCETRVWFMPQKGGQRQSRLEVRSVAWTLLASAELSGIGRVGQPKLDVTPSVWDFGAVQVGQSARVSFRVANNGEAIAYLQPITVGGPDFALVDDGSWDRCTDSLSVGSTCRLTLAFTPSARGAFSGKFFVATSNGATQASFSVEGKGIDPAALALAGPNTLANAFVGDPPAAAASYTVSNSGGEDSAVLAVTLEGANADQFAIVEDGCNGHTVPARGSCNLKVRFAPTSRGQKSASLVVTAAAQRLSTAIQALARQHATLALDWGNPVWGDVAAGSTRFFDFRNVGDEPTGPLLAKLADGTGAFSLGAVGGVNCANLTVLAPNAICSVSVTFTARVVGEQRDRLIFGGTTPAFAVEVSANFVSATDLQMPTRVAFGDRLTQPTTVPVRVSNVSRDAVGPLAVGFDPTPQWSLASDGCSGVTVPSGGSCVVSVTFTPTATASFTSSLTVGVPGKTVSAKLAAGGLVPAFVFSQTVNGQTTPITTLEFGTVSPGGFSDVKVVTVTNRSNRVWPTTTTITDPGSYTMMATDCPATLGIGATCTVSLRFVPRSPGDKPAELQYRNTEGTPTLPLHGTAQ